MQKNPQEKEMHMYIPTNLPRDLSNLPREILDLMGSVGEDFTPGKIQKELSKKGINPTLRELIMAINHLKSIDAIRNVAIPLYRPTKRVTPDFLNKLGSWNVIGPKE